VQNQNNLKNEKSKNNSVEVSVTLENKPDPRCKYVDNKLEMDSMISGETKSQNFPILSRSSTKIRTIKRNWTITSQPFLTRNMKAGLFGRIVEWRNIVDMYMPS